MTKLLYLEDEVFLAKIVKEGLERLGYEVHHLEDGGHVLDAFRRVQPDLCILDIMVPNLNGYEVAEQVRSIDSRVPIIFLSAKSETDDVVKGFQTGGDDYVKKPFSMEELDVRIQNLLRLKNNLTSLKDMDEYEICQGAVFNQQHHTLMIVDHIHQLSYKESQIFHHLITSPQGISIRKELLIKVWGDDSYFNSRTLDVYIRKLRKLIAPLPQLKIITLKGKGYQFVVD